MEIGTKVKVVTTIYDVEGQRGVIMSKRASNQSGRVYVYTVSVSGKLLNFYKRHLSPIKRWR